MLFMPTGLSCGAPGRLDVPICDPTQNPDDGDVITMERAFRPNVYMPALELKQCVSWSRPLDLWATLKAALLTHTGLGGSTLANAVRPLHRRRASAMSASCRRKGRARSLLAPRSRRR